MAKKADSNIGAATSALVNLKANLGRLTAIIELLRVGLNVDVVVPASGINKHLSRQLKMKMPKVNLTTLKRGVSNISLGIDKYVQRKGLIYDWYCVMVVAFVEAYLEEGLVLIATKNQTLLASGDTLSYQRVFEVNSLDDLKIELREQWAKKTLRGGPEKWLDRLKNMGARGYTKDCSFRIQHLWDTRNLIVHAQGIASAAYLKKQGKASLKPGDRVRVDETIIAWWNQGVADFVDPTEQFFLAYGNRVSG
jgi:hypothetical protein